MIFPVVGTLSHDRHETRHMKGVEGKEANSYSFPKQLLVKKLQLWVPTLEGQGFLCSSSKCCLDVPHGAGVGPDPFPQQSPPERRESPSVRFHSVLKLISEKCPSCLGHLLINQVIKLTPSWLSWLCQVFFMSDWFGHRAKQTHIILKDNEPWLIIKCKH